MMMATTFSSVERTERVADTLIEALRVP